MGRDGTAKIKQKREESYTILNNSDRISNAVQHQVAKEKLQNTGSYA